jgi:putative transposase
MGCRHDVHSYLGGFLYLAVVIGVFGRKIVDWSFGETMTTNLVISALNMALISRKPGKVIHHSDSKNMCTRFQE